MLVPFGGLLALLNIRFTIARYILFVCMVVVIYPAKKIALVFVQKMSADDKTLLCEFDALTSRRWLTWLSPMLLTILFAGALGYLYSRIQL